MLGEARNTFKATNEARKREATHQARRAEMGIPGGTYLLTYLLTCLLAYLLTYSGRRWASQEDPRELQVLLEGAGRP